MADLIVVMEKRHKQLINTHTKEKYDYKTKILNIPDRFKYFDRALIDLLEEKVKPYLDHLPDSP